MSSKHFCLIPKEERSCAVAADCEIYLYLPEAERVIFLDVYDKDEADDLTAEERREFAAIAQAIRLEFQHQA